MINTLRVGALVTTTGLVPFELSLLLPVLSAGGTTALVDIGHGTACTPVRENIVLTHRQNNEY